MRESEGWGNSSNSTLVNAKDYFISLDCICIFVIYLQITMITDMVHVGKIGSATCLDLGKPSHS